MFLLFFLFLFTTAFNCHAAVEKKIVVVITSYNNKDWYIKNLDSVFMQNYTNFRIIYIDDCSPDGTGKLVEAYVTECGQEWRTTLVLHTQWQSQMANHYMAVHMCQDDEIVCQLDGDDWLYDANTLSIINQIYSTDDVWLTVGMPLLSTGERVPGIPANMAQIIEKNSYRTEGWYFNHLRTFYAWLFKLIKLEDLLLQSNFAKVAPAPDVAMLYPMYEMAGRHGRLAHELLYVVNIKNPIRQCYLKAENDIVDVEYALRFGHPEYKPLYCPIVNRMNQFENKKADLFIWVEKGTFLHPEIIQITEMNLKNIATVSVVFEDNTPEIEQLKMIFPIWNFIEFNPRTTYFQSVLQHVLDCAGDYIIFASSDFALEQERDVCDCIAELERTFAYAFYFHFYNKTDLGAFCAPLPGNIVAWQPNFTKNIYEFPNTLGMVLYRKKDVGQKLKNFMCTNIGQFKQFWAKSSLPELAIGLFYQN